MVHTKEKKVCYHSKCTSSLPINNQSKKLHQLSDDTMKCALAAVTAGKMGVNRAAIEFNVPYTMLKD